MDKNVNPAFRHVSALGLSPAKTQYFVNRITPTNNPIVGLFTGAINAATGDLSKEIQTKGLKEMVLKNPSIKRISGLGDPGNISKEYIKDVKETDTTNMFVVTQKFDEKFEVFMRERTDKNMADVMLYIAEVANKNPQEGARLEKRVERGVALWQINGRKWWMNTAELTPESRASVFWSEYQASSKEKQREMLTLVDRVPGYASERFREALAKIIAQPSNKELEQSRKNEEENRKGDEE
jgi:hypothetical protein